MISSQRGSSSIPGRLSSLGLSVVGLSVMIMLILIFLCHTFEIALRVGRRWLLLRRKCIRSMLDARCRCGGDGDGRPPDEHSDNKI